MRDPVTRRPTLQAIVDQARHATGATTAWLLACRPGGLEVSAGSGPISAANNGGLLAVAGARAYALSSGQAVALMPQPGDPASAGLGGAAGVPGSVLLVPVAGWEPAATVGSRGSAGTVALLELADKAGARPFTLDDISRVGLLAPVAAAALAETAAPAGSIGPAPAPAPVPAPPALVAGLERLAGDDPACYAALAALIRAVLGPP